MAYDNYRWGVWLALGCLVLLISMLLLTGLIVGFIGFNTEDLPTQRTALSNAGGNLIVSGVVVSFVFAAIIMLVCVVCFVVGVPADRVVCQPLVDPDLEALAKLIDEPGESVFAEGLERDEYFLSSLLLNDWTVPLRLTDVLKECRDDGPIWQVLKLDNAYNLNSLIDVSAAVDTEQIGSQVTNEVSLSSVTILSPELTSLLSDFNDSLAAINITALQAQVTVPLTGADLQQVAATLRAIVPLIPAVAAVADTADDIYNLQVVPLQESQQTVSNLLADLDLHVKDTMANISTVLDALQTSQDAIRTNGSVIITRLVNEYIARLVGYGDQYIDHSIDLLKNDVGKCRTVWNVYNSATTLVCKTFLNAFNASWFCLGWAAVLLIPAVIFGMKLSKYFRRMKHAIGFADGNSAMEMKLSAGNKSASDL
ncbi:PREDICTED: prominin-1-A-like [Priapulus caudatus]|uniref:Prominin-1-A-like n=1 Tax=Priapulus caudatus TaxID=37621 RepID=A0ABM1EQG8_PRICU|nr:PREDICTED: prominin-1-A-like [Priapulus caudatus]